MDVVWKPIRGYEDYLINSNGDIKGKRGKMLKFWCDKDGYKTVSLYKSPTRKTCLVHRLVASTFIDNPHNYATVDHINNNKNDNRVENLQWLSRRDNVQKWCRENNKNIRPEKQNKLSMEQRKISVNQFTKDGDFVAQYKSLMDAERATGIRSGGISACINGRKPSAGGYIWRKVN